MSMDPIPATITRTFTVKIPALPRYAVFVLDLHATSADWTLEGLYDDREKAEDRAVEETTRDYCRPALKAVVVELAAPAAGKE